MPLADEGAVEAQHLADPSTGLVAVVEDEGVDAGVDPEELEVQGGDALKGAPIVHAIISPVMPPRHLVFGRAEGALPRGGGASIVSGSPWPGIGSTGSPGIG